MECPACSAQVPPDAIRAARRIAHCPSCDVTIDFAQDGENLVAVGFQEPAAPEGLRVELDEAPKTPSENYRDSARSAGGQFKASVRWFQPMIIFMTFFAIGWDSFLVFWYSTALTTNGPVIMLIFPLVHVAVGVGITLFVLAGWFNRTTVEVSEGQVRCRHAPIPVPFVKGGSVRLDEVSLFLVASKKSSSSRRGPVETSWGVDARLRSGRTVQVVTRLRDKEQARYVQRKLERFLS